MAMRNVQVERVQNLNRADVREGDYVLYWMQSSQRAEQNHALEYAVQRAPRRRSPRRALPPPQRGAGDAAHTPRPRRALGRRAGARGAYGRRRDGFPGPTRRKVTVALMPPEDP